MKSSFAEPDAKRPERSVTVAVTLISSTPLLKRKPSCPATGRSAAASVPRAASPVAMIQREVIFMAPLLLPTCRPAYLPTCSSGSWSASIDVRHEARLVAEAHPIARDVGRCVDVDDER